MSSKQHVWPELRLVSRGRRYGCHLLSLLVAAIVSLLSPLAFAGPASASEAKALAESSEASLSNEQLQLLVKAQGVLAASAFPACASRGAVPASFTVVVELAATGRVLNSWVLGESPFTQCFRSAMSRGFSFQPPRVPFFTAFEYSAAK
jgi:hypothetical protein